MSLERDQEISRLARLSRTSVRPEGLEAKAPDWNETVVHAELDGQPGSQRIDSNKISRTISELVSILAGGPSPEERAEILSLPQDQQQARLNEIMSKK